MKLPLFKSFLLLAFIVFTLAGCQKEYESIDQLDEKNIKEYITKNNLQVAQYGSTGVYYQVLKQGTGAAISYEEKIPLFYTISSLDGVYASQDTFANRYGGFFGYFSSQNVREVIKSALVKKGGQIRVLIPSRFAFGRNGSGSIPPNASLDYVITVLDEAKLAEYEDQSISKYMQANSLTGFTKTSEGIYYKITAPGTGSQITIDSIVTAKYVGKLLNGKIFDQRDAQSFSLNGGVIKGWSKMVPLIKEGGAIRIILPSTQAYGMTGSSPDIPAFSSLDFDITISKVEQGSQ